MEFGRTWWSDRNCQRPEGLIREPEGTERTSVRRILAGEVVEGEDSHGILEAVRP